ncbi:MAG TPA: hypothetical protein VGR52_05960 [Stellaceae bacterium]|nr:hypothetical protein [Stellaceae bacterium]
MTGRLRHFESAENTIASPLANALTTKPTSHETALSPVTPQAVTPSPSPKHSTTSP